MRVAVLKQGAFLIAALQDALTDSGWQRLRDDLLSSVGDHRSRGTVIDVSAMDVMDSYAARALDGIARMLSLRGAETVVVGIQPGVAFAMAQLGLTLASAGTALDLDDGLALLAKRLKDSAHGG
jgi:rsbT antagonist protein RsbS